MQKIKTKLIYPVFISHQGCPNQCIFCNQFSITKVDKIDWSNTLEGVRKFIYKYHDQNKEIAFFGGSFTNLSLERMQKLFDIFHDLLDEYTFFRISCRPDAINDKILNFLKNNRVNTIELGIQSFSDNELVACKRGYTKEIAYQACLLVKKHNFMLGLQFLIGLPDFCDTTFNETVQTTLSINPDYIRLYPLLVLRNTELEILYSNNQFNPLQLEIAIEYCIDFCQKISNSNIEIIKIGIHSDINIDKTEIVDGPFHANFGEIVKGRLLANQIIDYLEKEQKDTIYISDSTASQLHSFNKYPLKYIEKNIQKKIKIIIDKNLRLKYH